MKFNISYFSYLPQLAAIVVATNLGILASQAQTTYLGYWVILIAVAVNSVAASYCSYMMDKGLTIPKLCYYEKTAFLWETVAEELRKQGKFAEPETLVQALIGATEAYDKGLS